MGTPQRADRRYTYADSVSWPDEVRWELIDGAAFAMTPAPSWRHQELVSNLLYQLRLCLRDRPCAVAVAPLDVRLGRADAGDAEIDTVLQPDLVVVCDPARIDARGVKGAPDLVVEVLSPATALRDTVEKRAAYEGAGVPEYWLVDPEGQRVLVLVLEDGRYGRARSFPPGATLRSAHMPALELEIAAIFSSALGAPSDQA